jgi:hypothetical protein
MRPYRSLYGTQRWRLLSREVIAAARGRCAIPGCLAPADSCDHYPVSAMEAFEANLPELFWDPENLRALCRSHNSSLGAALGNRARRRRRRVSFQEEAERRAIQWAERENAYWAGVERERQAARPRIF